MDNTSSKSSLHFARHFRNVGRFTQIVNVFAKHGFWTLLDSAGIKNWLTPEQVREAEEISRREETGPAAVSAKNLSGIPMRVRLAFEELGPTFVKLGQMLASRKDLLPDSFLLEFAKLHQDVSPISFKVIKQIIEDELSPEARASIVRIDESPVAAGSIGQVHKVHLKSGETVVMKVQRPNIVDQMQTDLSLMDVLAGLLERYVPESRFLRPRVIIEEFSQGLLAELDFIREAGNTSKIAGNLSKMDYIKIPTVYWDLTTHKVLTISYIEGHKISEKKEIEDVGLTPSLLVERGLGAFLQMVFVDGLYHGDLHAGNLMALANNHVAILDFGLTVRLGQHSRENLAGLLVALVKEDYENMVSHFVELTDPEPSFNATQFEEDVGSALAPFMGLKLAKIPTAKILWQIAQISAKHGAAVPRQMISFFKTLAAFEGIGSRLDPDFDILATCQKFSKDLVEQMYSKDYLRKQSLSILRDVSNLARHAPRQVRMLLKKALDGELSIHLKSSDLKYVAFAVDRLSARLAIAIIVAALVIGSSILVLAKVGDEYYHMSLFGLLGFAIAGCLGFYVVWSIIRGGSGKI